MIDDSRARPSDQALVPAASSPQAVSTEGFDPSRIAELAKMCEQATGPDRKLDAAICREIDLPLCVYPDCVPDVLEAIIVRTESGQWDQDPDCPFYTASLDAAMTLVPEGDGPFILTNADLDVLGDYSRWRVSLEEGGDLPIACATPALALCAATLKSRAASADTLPESQDTKQGLAGTESGAVPDRADAQPKEAGNRL